MRQIIIKTTTSENHKRKNLFITEMLEQNGITAKAEKKYSYYVSEQKVPQNSDGFPQITPAMGQLDYHKKDRHVSIRKIYDPVTGSGQMVYRVIGSFYVVQNLHIFAVVFMHSVKFDLPATTFGKSSSHGNIHIDPVDFNLDIDPEKLG